jgi:hypothetical protein
LEVPQKYQAFLILSVLYRMIAVFIIQPVITQKFQAELFAVKI